MAPRSPLTMTEPSDVDVITAALHGDKQTVLRESIKMVQREILENIILKLAQEHDLYETIKDLRNQLAQASPAESQPENAQDRRDRLKLQEQVIAEQRALHDLQLKINDANASLKHEEREYLSRLLENELRHERFSKLT